MDSKKIIIPVTILLIIIGLAGIVLASDYDQSGGADPERGISIEEIEFNIPDGYEIDNAKTVVNQSNSSGNTSFVYNEETFKNSDGEEIIITIVDYDDFDVDADMLYKICEGYSEKTLMGYPGYIDGNESYTQFAYAFDNRAVCITAPDEDLIKQILVVEDS